MEAHKKARDQPEMAILSGEENDARRSKSSSTSVRMQIYFMKPSEKNGTRNRANGCRPTGRLGRGGEGNTHESGRSGTGSPYGGRRRRIFMPIFMLWHFEPTCQDSAKVMLRLLPIMTMILSFTCLSFTDNTRSNRASKNHNSSSFCLLQGLLQLWLLSAPFRMPLLVEHIWRADLGRNNVEWGAGLWELSDGLDRNYQTEDRRWWKSYLWQL